MATRPPIAAVTAPIPAAFSHVHGPVRPRLRGEPHVERARARIHAAIGRPVTTSTSEIPAPAAAPPSERPRLQPAQQPARRAPARAPPGCPIPTPSPASPSTRWRLRKSSARSSWEAVKYCWASTGAGSIRPLRGRSRKVAAAAAATATTKASGSRERPIPRHCRSLQMRIALLSDVHGNLPAFEAVLGDVDDESRRGGLVPRRPRRLRRPAGRVRGSSRGSAATCRLAGNHDLVVTGEIPISDFSASAAAAARWTQRDDRRGHDGVPERPRARRTPTREPALYHASPRDPVWEYVLSTWQADECIDVMDARVARRRPLARGALVPPRRRRARVGRHGGRRRAELDLSDGRAGW